MSGWHNHKKTYFKVWMALLLLTVTTVAAAYQNFGIFNIVVAIGVATVKATLVCLFFMHLKYDNKLDRVVFTSAFIFLVVFISLTLSDKLYRPHYAAATVKALEAPAGSQATQMKAFLHTSPELVAKGQGIYLANCQACHGAEGKGDGAAAAVLQPKPRDFTSGLWQQGGAPAQVFKTISEGMAGTPMPPFGTLAMQDRWALVHFVRSLSPNTPPDTPETLAAIGLAEGQDAAAAPQELPPVPVDFAIERLAEETVQGGAAR